MLRSQINENKVHIYNLCPERHKSLHEQHGFILVLETIYPP